ncbi:hypothetical protein HYO99_gp22 [Roseobacter phage RD-1410W1-01]|uniref:Uncharacterized protein n=1 Tax=Roseobacter phage RD-1410W1-01 TaxID=1815984 RepID=A0A191VYH1_9CAUD|nr:hypothetical protein HYO99_gp22 [Roseobacter phage RD-1410W1-01]ANJ20756.1 hypothetical protein RDp01_gp22 [Roseobacter phage RD-1410W1-01]
MAKWDLSKLQSENDKKGSNSIYDLRHHGDEVIVGTDGNKIKIALKTQTGKDEFRSTLLTFDTQTQMERLLPSIMKGLSYANR